MPSALAVAVPRFPFTPAFIASPPHSPSPGSLSCPPSSAGVVAYAVASSQPIGVPNPACSGLRFARR
jgi:hypothetical protein